MSQQTQETPQTPQTPEPTQASHDGLDRAFDTIRGWGVRRRVDDKWIGGVCSGLADRWRIDPVVVRAGFVLLALCAGLGLTAYLLAWALLPDTTGQSAAEKAVRHGETSSVVLLVVAGISLAFSPLFFGHQGGWTPFGVLLLAAFVWWAVRRSRGQELLPRSQPRPVSLTKGAGTDSSPSTTWAAVGTDSVVPPVSPPRPRRARRRSGGLLMTLVALGTALLGYGLTLVAADRFSFAGDHHVIALAAALALLGLLVTGLGVAGWRAGFVGFLAGVLAVVTLAAGTVGAVGEGQSFGGRLGDTDWTPTTTSDGAPFRILAGDGRLDLSNLAVPVGAAVQSPTSLPVSIGAGDLTIVVPDGMTVSVQAHVGAGQITAPGDPTRAENRGGGGLYSGTDVSRTVTVGDGTPTVTVIADVALGQIIISKESA